MGAVFDVDIEYPFDEVHRIVKHLKSIGQPDYNEAILQEMSEGNGGFAETELESNGARGVLAPPPPES